MSSKTFQKNDPIIDYESYYTQERKRVAKNYNKAKHKGIDNRNDFADWFIGQLKAHNCQCHYCETSIHDIERLINSGLLKQRKTGFGYRGKILEIDKNDDDYTKHKCVLSCYYCNNDKSYTSEKDEYKEHFGANRYFYFKKLSEKLKVNV
jgi:hypothetical protein